MEVIRILSERLENLLVDCNAHIRARECFEVLLKAGITEEQIEETFVIHNESELFPYDFKLKMLEYISEIWNQLETASNAFSVSDMKKRIKHCKNPMEKNRLEKELNSLYKERKHK